MAAGIRLQPRSNTLFFIRNLFYKTHAHSDTDTDTLTYTFTLEQDTRAHSTCKVTSALTYIPTQTHSSAHRETHDQTPINGRTSTDRPTTKHRQTDRHSNTQNHILRHKPTAWVPFTGAPHPLHNLELIFFNNTTAVTFDKVYDHCYTRMSSFSKLPSVHLVNISSRPAGGMFWVVVGGVRNVLRNFIFNEVPMVVKRNSSLILVNNLNTE